MDAAVPGDAPQSPQGLPALPPPPIPGHRSPSRKATWRGRPRAQSRRGARGRAPEAAGAPSRGRRGASEDGREDGTGADRGKWPLRRQGGQARAGQGGGLPGACPGMPTGAPPRLGRTSSPSGWQRAGPGGRGRPRPWGGAREALCDRILWVFLLCVASGVLALGSGTSLSRSFFSLAEDDAGKQSRQRAVKRQPSKAGVGRGREGTHWGSGTSWNLVLGGQQDSEEAYVRRLQKYFSRKSRNHPAYSKILGRDAAGTPYYDWNASYPGAHEWTAGYMAMAKEVGGQALAGRLEEDAEHARSLYTPGSLYKLLTRIFPESTSVGPWRDPKWAAHLAGMREGGALRRRLRAA